MFIIICFITNFIFKCEMNKILFFALFANIYLIQVALSETKNELPSNFKTEEKKTVSAFEQTIMDSIANLKSLLSPETQARHNFQTSATEVCGRIYNIFDVLMYILDRVIVMILSRCTTDNGGGYYHPPYQRYTTKPPNGDGTCPTCPTCPPVTVSTTQQCEIETKAPITSTTILDCETPPITSTTTTPTLTTTPTSTTSTTTPTSTTSTTTPTSTTSTTTTTSPTPTTIQECETITTPFPTTIQECELITPHV